MYNVTVFGAYGEEDRTEHVLAVDHADAAEHVIRRLHVQDGHELMVVKERGAFEKGQPFEVHFEWINGELVRTGVTQ